MHGADLFGRLRARDCEAPAPTANGLERLELVLRVELAAQARHEHVDVVALALDVFFVHAFAELGSSEHLTRAKHEVLEQPILVGREIDRLVVYADGLATGIERNRAAD